MEFIEFLSESALAELKIANSELVKMVANVENVSKKMQSISTPSGSDGAIKDLAKRYADQEKQLQKVQKELERTRLAEIKLAQAREKAFDSYETQLNKENSYLEKNTNLYNKVQAKINSLIPQYNSLATKKELGIKLTNEEAIRLEFLTGKILGYENALKRVDANRGKFNREVGNYSKATENLNRSLTTIATEIPNFFQSVTIGLRSISNNIQPVRDGLKGVRNEAKELGKEAPNAFMSIVKGLVNWQSVLFIGIGLLTAYGEEIWNWTKALFSGKEALSEIYKVQDDFNKSRLQSSAKTKQEVENLKEYIKIAKNASGAFSAEQTEAAFEVLRRAGKGYFEDLKNSEIFGKKGEKALREFTKAIEAQAKAQDLLSANAKTNERINELQAEAEARKKYAQDQKDIIDSLSRKEITYDESVKKRSELRSSEEERRSRRSKSEDKLLTEAIERGFEYKLRQSVYEEKSIKLTNTLNALREEEANQRQRINKELDDSVVLEGKIDNDKKIRQKKDKIALTYSEIESEYNLKLAILERQKTERSDRMNNDDLDFETRLKAREEFSDKSIEILELEAKKEKAIFQEKYLDDLDKNNLAYKNKDISAEQWRKNIVDIQKRLSNELLTVDMNYSLKWNDLLNQNADFYRNFQDKNREYTEQTNKLILENEKNKYEKLSNDNKKTLTLRQKAFEQYINLAKKELEVQKVKELANAKSNEEVILITQKFTDAINKLNEIKSPFKKGTEETEEFIQKLASGQIEQSLNDIGLSSAKMFLDFDKNGQSTFDKLIEGADNFKEKFALTFQGIGDIAQEVIGMMQNLENQRSEQQLANLEKEYQTALLFAGESTTAREELERQYDERRKVIQRRQAQQQKQLAIFNILVNTAQGVVSALAMTPPNVPLSIAIGAIGALQAGIVASQQLPQFYKGTDNAPEGWAYTQEKGAEIITDKNGKIKTLGSNKGAELTYLNKGDKVYTAQQTSLMFDNNLNEILTNNGILMPKVNINVDNSLTNAKLDAIADAIKSKETLQMNYDAKGMSMYRIEQGNKIKMNNLRLRTKGYDI